MEKLISFLINVHTLSLKRYKAFYKKVYTFSAKGI